jgi:hypothetical protein
MSSRHHSHLNIAGLILVISGLIWLATTRAATLAPLESKHPLSATEHDVPVGGGEVVQMRSVAQSIQPSEPEPEPEPEPEDAATLESGVVLGVLFDFDGEPVARGRVAFERFGTNGDFGAFHFADDDGEFRVELEEGAWTAYYAGTPATQDGGLLAMGTVDVRANQDAYLDLYLPGQRKLVGGFHRSDEDMVLLEVEVRAQADPDRIVAKTLCATDKTEHAEFLASLEREDHDVIPSGPAPGVGRFLIEGLPPAHYEIRAYMDIGKRFYVRADLDLTGADMEFDPVTLVEGDFLGRKLLEL